VTFISTEADGQRDIMTATAMFVEESENLLVISVARDHLTAKLIAKARGFTLVVAAEDQTDLARKLGSVRGLDEDKFERFSIQPLSSRPGKPLVPEGASAWLDCEVVGEHETDKYLLFTAMVVAQEDLGRPPLIWQKGGFFGLNTT
jgi:flavin reductase (DIM6/NTAB) family NADH-FMN oxidoreductase RutF